VWALLRVVGLTWRFEIIAEEGAAALPFGEGAAAEIFCFWHQCVLPCAIYFRRTGGTILISRSFDGELITRILAMFGFRAVRGSSSRGAREGLLGLKSVIDGGGPAIFTADGPRGPIYRAKMGPIKLAQMTGARNGAFHLEPDRTWTMHSWDRFLVPKPFTRIVVSWARWTSVPADLAEENFESKREELNAAIERARLRARTFREGRRMSSHEEKSENVEVLRVTDFDFDLPEELIAQQPPVERGLSRMLVMSRATGACQDSAFAELPSLLKPGDLLVLNDSRVIPARLYALRTLIREREKPTGRVEVMLTEPAGKNRWRALVRPGRKVAIGERLVFPAPGGEILLQAEVLERGQFGERTLQFEPVDDFFAVLDRIGHMPLPPYIHRDDVASDRERYQTVFARERGSVAAPTAGLHFTNAMLEALQASGIEIARITLHVGLGTFAPLRVERVNEIRLHRERYTLTAAAAEAVNRAVFERRRIVAVGTTVARTLESAAFRAQGREISPHSEDTDLFVSPGFGFRLVGALLTNFHLPQSSLLMLVSAFAGRERVLAAYRRAVEARYRFFSYGDCMFIQ
jgi:S-adenosylmethionine:tRNA ribosyltransferase-isomerase